MILEKHVGLTLESIALQHADLIAGYELQQRIGPWIACLGSGVPGTHPIYTPICEKIARLIGTDLHFPVATGGADGRMLDYNRGAKEAGGCSVGVYCSDLPTEQQANPYCTEQLICRTFPGRQQILLTGAVALVIGPDGGIGTVSEKADKIVHSRIVKLSYPIMVVDYEGHWERFLDWTYENLVCKGLWSPQEHEHVHRVTCPEEAIEKLKKYLLPGLSPQ
jgi:uncharacterized protein (TIGR00730 family)